MKRRIILPLALTAVLLCLASACKKECTNLRHARLTHTETSGCLLHTDKLAAKDMTDSILVDISDGTLNVHHNNILLDCHSENHIITTMRAAHDTIFVTEDVGEQGLTNCVCLYDNLFQIEQVPQSTFTLVIYVTELCGGIPYQTTIYQHTFNR